LPLQWRNLLWFVCGVVAVAAVYFSQKPKNVISTEGGAFAAAVEKSAVKSTP